MGSLLQDQGAKKETVTAITLEDLFKENHIDQVDYLKLDVEGAEYPILLDCPAETLQRTRHLVLEYHEFDGAPWEPQDLERHLCLHGFQASREPGLVDHNKLFGTGIMLARRE